MSGLIIGMYASVKRLIAERDTARDEAAKATARCVVLADRVRRLDSDLIEAHGRIETREEQVAAARAGRGRQRDGVTGTPD